MVKWKLRIHWKLIHFEMREDTNEVHAITDNDYSRLILQKQFWREIQIPGFLELSLVYIHSLPNISTYCISADDTLFRALHTHN